MKTFLLYLKDHWQSVAIPILLAVVILFWVHSCNKPVTVTDNRSKIDSLTNANEQTVARYDRKADSLTKRISASEQANNKLTSELNYISEKYVELRTKPHSVDTLVKWDTLMDGMECLEKMPIFVQKIENLESVVTDLKLKVVTREQEIKEIQGQFDSSVALNKKQDADNKKLARRLKWHKTLNYIEAGVGVAAITAILIFK
jgi:hypothetical protein